MEGTQGPDAPSGMRALLANNWFRALMVFLAAAIVFGAWAFADLQRGGAHKGGGEVALELDDYERARRAAEAGDTDEAIQILERVLAEDPNHESAAALLNKLRGGKGSAAGEGTGEGEGSGGAEGGSGQGTAEQPSQPAPAPDGPRPIADSVLAAPMRNLDVLLPQVIVGWERGSTVVDETAATVPFLPTKTEALSRVLYAVHDRGTPERAKAFIDTTSRAAYLNDVATVKIGREEGYFGTDGHRLATAVFARGQYVFEVVATVDSGEVAAAKDATIAMAQEFEASK